MSPDILQNRHHGVRMTNPVEPWPVELDYDVKTVTRQCKGEKARELLFDKLIEGSIRPDSAHCPPLRF